MYVVLDYDLRSPGVWLDEDELFSPFNQELDLWSTEMFSKPGHWVFERLVKKSGAYDPEEYGNLSPLHYGPLTQEILRADFSKEALLVLKKLASDYPALLARIRQPRLLSSLVRATAAVVRGYILHLLEQHFKDHRKDLREYAIWSLEKAPEGSRERANLLQTIKALDNPPTGMQGTHERLTRAVAVLSKMTAGISSQRAKGGLHNVRLMEPVSFRGKNRIVLVVEIRPDRALVVHYMGSRPVLKRFVNEYRRVKGGLSKIVKGPPRGYGPPH